MNWSVDRLEENIVVCENDLGEQKNFKIDNFAVLPKEGMIFSDETKPFAYLEQLTAQRRQAAAEKLKRILSQK